MRILLSGKVSDKPMYKHASNQNEYVIWRYIFVSIKKTRNYYIIVLASQGARITDFKMCFTYKYLHIQVFLNGHTLS